MKNPGRTTYAGIGVVALLAGLAPGLLGTPSSNAAPSPSQWRSMGGTHAANGTLRNGCHFYRYRYHIDPPSGTWWSLETFLVGPKKTHLASDVVLSGQDGRTGTKRFEICKPNTRPGRFLIKAKLTYKDYPNEYSGWVEPSHFRLKRP